MNWNGIQITHRNSDNLTNLSRMVGQRRKTIEINRQTEKRLLESATKDKVQELEKNTQHQKQERESVFICWRDWRRRCHVCLCELRVSSACWLDVATIAPQKLHSISISLLFVPYFPPRHPSADWRQPRTLYLSLLSFFLFFPSILSSILHSILSIVPYNCPPILHFCPFLSGLCGCP